MTYKFFPPLGPLPYLPGLLGQTQSHGPTPRPTIIDTLTANLQKDEFFCRLPALTDVPIMAKLLPISVLGLQAPSGIV